MFYLIITILADVIGIALLGKAQGTTHPWMLIAGLASMIIGFAAFSFATQTIPVAVANALWSSVSIALVLIVGCVFFGQHMTTVRYGFLLLLLVGVVGLQLSE